MNKKFIKKKKLSKKVQATSVSLLANFPLMFFLLLLSQKHQATVTVSCTFLVLLGLQKNVKGLFKSLVGYMFGLV